MVVINYKQFPIYELDTDISILQRIATDIFSSTLPKYIYFPGGIPKWETGVISGSTYADSNILAEDLLEEIKSSDDFMTLYENISKKMGQQNLTVKDIVEMYLVLGEQFTKNSELTNMQLLLLKTTLEEKNIYSNSETEEIWENRKKIKEHLLQEIKDNKNLVTKQKKLNEEFISIDPSNFSKFDLEYIQFEVNLGKREVSILELFNFIQLNIGVPFASIDNFFKILKDFTPPEEWSVCLEDAIIFHVSQSRRVAPLENSVRLGSFAPPSSARLLEEYLPSVIKIDEDRSISLEIRLQTSSDNLSMSGYIQRILDVFPEDLDLKEISRIEGEVRGVFYFPDQELNIYILSDMIMNDPLFSSLMYIDESQKASKDKNSIYVHFNHALVGHIGVTITQKTVEDETADRGVELFPVGSQYLRVKIGRAGNLYVVQEFQNMLGRIISLYNKNYSKVEDIYVNFISKVSGAKAVKEFRGKKSTKVKKKGKSSKALDSTIHLKSIAPEVFPDNYSRICPHKPTIISDEEAKIAIRKGEEIMKFPRKDSGLVQRNYICKHKKNKYPGLLKNTIINNRMEYKCGVDRRNLESLEQTTNLEYLPCCYTKSHADTEGNYYGHYFRGEKLIEKKTEQQNLIKTEKFVNNDEFGLLPENLAKMFAIYYPDDSYTFIRKGLTSTLNSFLDCVLEGLERLHSTDISRVEELEIIRKKLATKSKAASCRQEMYDFSSEEIMEAINDNDCYFDPRFFTNLLQEEYNCNIFVFSRNAGDKDGNLILPRHLQSYYNTPRKSGKCIFIFEHMGSKSDQAQYPRCELIVKWKKDEAENVDYSSKYGSELCDGIVQIYNKVRESYALNKIVPETFYRLNIHPVGQGIDSYGKCRMLQFQYKTCIIAVFTSPIQPLAIPELNTRNFSNNSEEIVREFGKKMEIVFSSQQIAIDTDIEVLQALSGILGNVEISIPVEPGPIDNFLPISSGLNYSQEYKGLSEISLYNESKKYARYIGEYTCWLFSKFIQLEGESTDIDLLLGDFIKNNVTVDEDFDYGHVPNEFSMSSGLMKKNKLVINSIEALSRLTYFLKMYTLRHNKDLISYHQRKKIQNYYVDITDFDQHRTQVILQGDESIEKWISEQKKEYHLYNKVQPSFNRPYFFKNKLVGNCVFLLQNIASDNLLEALKIAYLWYTAGYNPGEQNQVEINLPSDVKFTLFSYINYRRITPYQCRFNSPSQFSFRKGKSISDIALIGYKLDNNVFYNALLKL